MQYNESHIVLLNRYLAEVAQDESLYELIKTAISAIERHLKGGTLPLLPIRLKASLVINSPALLSDDTDFGSRELQYKIKSAELKTVFETSANQAVTVNGVVWDGGFDSALRLDGAQRLAEQAGLGVAVFHDAANNTHELSFADAMTVVTTISAAFQECLAVKQSIARDLVKDATALEIFDVAAEFSVRMTG